MRGWRRSIARALDRWVEQLPTAHADLAPVYAAAPALAPARPDRPVPRIAMARERVEIELYPNAAVVIAAFEMHNPDGPTDLAVAFPSVGGNDTFPAFYGGPLDDFTAIAGGPALWSAPFFDFGDPAGHLHPEQQVDEGGEYPAWHIWRQHFDHGVTVVKVRYACRLAGYIHGGRMPFTYVLRTGGLWHGNIGEAVVRVRAMGIPFHAIREACPSNYEMSAEDRSLTWRFVDLDPQTDISLLVSQHVARWGRLRVVPETVPGVVARRPALGERVLVGGRLHPHQPPTTRCDLPPVGGPCLVSERWWDDNTLVPKGIATLSRDAPGEVELMTLPIRFDGGTRSNAEYRGRTIWRAWVVGTVVEFEGRRGIAAEMVYDVIALSRFGRVASYDDGRSVLPPWRTVTHDAPEGDVRTHGWLLPGADGATRHLQTAAGVRVALSLPPRDGLDADGLPVWRPMVWPVAERPVAPSGAVPVCVVGTLHKRSEGPLIDVRRAYDGRMPLEVPASDRGVDLKTRHPWVDPSTDSAGSVVGSPTRWPSDAAEAGRMPRWRARPARVDARATAADLGLVPHATTDPDELA